MEFVNPFKMELPNTMKPVVNPHRPLDHIPPAYCIIFSHTGQLRSQDHRLKELISITDLAPVLQMEFGLYFKLNSIKTHFFIFISCKSKIYKDRCTVFLCAKLGVILEYWNDNFIQFRIKEMGGVPF